MEGERRGSKLLLIIVTMTLSCVILKECVNGVNVNDLEKSKSSRLYVNVNTIYNYNRTYIRNIYRSYGTYNFEACNKTTEFQDFESFEITEYF